MMDVFYIVGSVCGILALSIIIVVVVLNAMRKD